MGYFGSFFGHLFVLIFFGQKCNSVIFITFSISGIELIIEGKMHKIGKTTVDFFSPKIYFSFSFSLATFRLISLYFCFVTHILPWWDFYKKMCSFQANFVNKILRSIEHRKHLRKEQKSFHCNALDGSFVKWVEKSISVIWTWTQVKR